MNLFRNPFKKTTPVTPLQGQPKPTPEPTIAEFPLCDNTVGFMVDSTTTIQILIKDNQQLELLLCINGKKSNPTVINYQAPRLNDYLYNITKSMILIIKNNMKLINYITDDSFIHVINKLIDGNDSIKTATEVITMLNNSLGDGQKIIIPANEDRSNLELTLILKLILFASIKNESFEKIPVMDNFVNKTLFNLLVNKKLIYIYQGSTEINTDFPKFLKVINDSVRPPLQGGALKRTKDKVKTCKGERCVYVGKRGKKYIKMGGEFVPYRK